ncbi:ribonuclease P protein component [Novipirellula artificiosorum]|uniref:Ribonuclease P protein component n=1 Tax=Novipirellula artificiosorum TaxID=2528016 RepID=A0A5C6D5I4_9BACT|nr:ribonuclease P protein component [Novipirellula artificiosorum]TWU30981.1 Ribonuclease P protein component [Novipirellula artificiosorum]
MRYFFPKSRRIVRSDRFTIVLRQGACAADGVLVLFAVAQSTPGPTRIGITIPRRAGNAVIRNRWKRWIRESFRTQWEHLPAGLDIVVRPKKGATPAWKTIRKSVPSLARKAAKRLQA